MNLHIFVLTRNRAKFLHRTLEQLFASPFKDCLITVLDDASTDQTSQICRLYNGHRNFTVIHHHKNVGYGANYMRAIEESRGVYTWILHDDDSIDFHKVGDVLSHIEEEIINGISVGVECHDIPKGLRIKVQDLVLAEGCSFFISHSYAPSLIFSTKFWHQIVDDGYRFCDTNMPQMVLLVNFLNYPLALFYTSKEVIITKQVNCAYSIDRFKHSWKKIISLISNKKFRKICKQELHGTWLTRFAKYFGLIKL